MLGQGWQGQWARVQRRLDGVRDVYADTPSPGTEGALDSVLCFFEAIHHLRDWLGNDPAITVKEADCNALINKNLSLRLCGDLANGSKHLKLTSTWTGDLSTTIPGSEANVLLGPGTVAHRFHVESGGRRYDALQVAEDGVAEWATFLSSRGLH